MEYSFLGNSGMRMSQLCMGTMTFGTAKGGPFGIYEHAKQSNEALAHELLDRYVELGGNFLDTADIYSFGKSEQIIGTWLKKHDRDDIVVATKCCFPMDYHSGGKAPNKGGLSRRHIIQSCEASLERLQTNYIDLYQAHDWDNGTTVEETLRTFDDLVRCGKIRYYGYSNVCGWQMQQIVDTAKYMGLSPCITLQQQYNLLCRESELEAFMVCHNNGIGVLPWSPLQSGLLSGKYVRDTTPCNTQTRIGYLKEQSLPLWDMNNKNDKFWELIEAMQKIGKNKDKTIAQVALRWLLQKPVVSSVIIGATSMYQLNENMGAVGWELSEDEMIVLDSLSTPTSLMLYPYSSLWQKTLASTQRYNKYHKGSIDLTQYILR